MNSQLHTIAASWRRLTKGRRHVQWQKPGQNHEFAASRALSARLSATGSQPSADREGKSQAGRMAGIVRGYQHPESITAVQACHQHSLKNRAAGPSPPLLVGRDQRSCPCPHRPGARHDATTHGHSPTTCGGKWGRSRPDSKQTRTDIELHKPPQVSVGRQSHGRGALRRQRAGLDRIEQQPKGALGMAAVLHPEAKQHDVPLAVGYLHHSWLARQMLWTS